MRKNSFFWRKKYFLKKRKQVVDVYQLPLTMVGEREACLGAALAVFDRWRRLCLCICRFLCLCICLDRPFAVFDRCLCLCICHLLCLWKAKVKVAISIELWRRMTYLRRSYSQCCWWEPAPLYLKDLVSCLPRPLLLPPSVNNLLFSYAFSYRHCAPQATVNMWAASKSGGNSQQNIVRKM